MEKRVVLAAAACAVVPGAMTGSAFGDYEYGFVWQRQADWVPGQNDGGTTNNPGPDGLGAPVWKYEYTSGGSLSSEDPWYVNAGTKLVWDSVWHDSDDGVWARGNNDSPPIYASAVLHHNLGKFDAAVPVVRWNNPAGDGALVNLSGTFTMEWDSGNDKAFDNDVDFVIALADASAGTVLPLFAETFSKPTEGISATESIAFGVDLENIALDDGDSLLITHRADTVQHWGWISVFDDYDITFVPTPATASLMGLAGLVMTRRRR